MCFSTRLRFAKWHGYLSFKESASTGPFSNATYEKRKRFFLRFVESVISVFVSLFSFSRIAGAHLY